MRTQSEQWIGQALGQVRYQVTAKVDEGGMGTVYKAWDRSLETDVVVKVPKAALLADPVFASRFTREIRSLVQLTHPHIVKVVDVGSHLNQPFAVMQFLPAGSLLDRLKKQGTGRLQPNQLHGWLGQIASALDFIHQRRYVHRDVKPGNILFDHQGNAYLSDFGIIKALSGGAASAGTNTTLTGTGHFVGTPRYMAPELLKDEAIDGRVDQYALAVMLYELLSGTTPFAGSSFPIIMQKQLTEVPPPLAKLSAHIPSLISAAIEKSMIKDPQRRFATCTELAQAVLLAVGPAPAAQTVNHPRPSSSAKKTEAARVACPSCGKPCRLPAGAEGKVVQCPACRVKFRAPASFAAVLAAPTTQVAEAAVVNTVTVQPVAPAVAEAPQRRPQAVSEETRELRTAVFRRKLEGLLRALRLRQDKVLLILECFLVAIVAFPAALAACASVIIGALSLRPSDVTVAALWFSSLLLAIGVLTAFVVFVLRRRKWAVHSRTRTLKNDFADELQEWGGEAVLEDTAALDELIKLLRRR
jgi:serine/threonine-protein kinase